VDPNEASALTFVRGGSGPLGSSLGPATPPPVVSHLQRSYGNVALTHLLAGTHVQRQAPGGATATAAPAPPATPRAPASLRSAIGTLDYYRRRNADFIARNGPSVAPPDYYLGYGDKYVRRFSAVLRPTLSRAGKAWLDCTLITLQTAVEDRRDANPAAFAALERDSDAFREFAYATHSDAYTSCGLCHLSAGDLAAIVATPDLADIATVGGAVQIVETGIECLREWSR
jgi:hypothetical protein